MTHYLTTALFLVASVTHLFAQLPAVSSGRIIRYSNFPSAFVQPRNIDVWIPSQLDSTKPFNVLYMHDGQMLFDSNTTWNKQEWGVDETIAALIQQQKIRQTIVVGIWNIPKRRPEYFPKKVFDDIPLPLRDSIQKDISSQPTSDLYLKFLVTELKPFIDSTFKTSKDKAHTFIAGSSMGGLISFYALCEYPEVFSGAACLSIHWPGSVYRNTKEVPEAFARYANRYLPNPPPAKLYFDYGTLGLDAWYEYGSQLVKKELAARGYTKRNYTMLKFEGKDHSEKAWKERLAIPFEYLLNTK